MASDITRLEVTFSYFHLSVVFLSTIIEKQANIYVKRINAISEMVCFLYLNLSLSHCLFTNFLVNHSIRLY